ncbi:hypothetical protein BC833DRAFT_602643 [Globomyces pollinis-pini]|nr:hypothetical protein BC833DRAFT_602643 [Globomyces pollinis-pini]
MISTAQRNLLSSFFGNPIDNNMIDTISKAVSQVMKGSSTCFSNNSKTLPFLPYFVEKLVHGSQISSAVLFIALYYIEKLKRRVDPNATVMPCTSHRTVLASFIVAEKVLCDVPMKNKSWMAHAKYFNLNEINSLERHFLILLDYKLEVDGDILYALIERYCNMNPKNPVKIRHQPVSQNRLQRAYFPYPRASHTHNMTNSHIYNVQPIIRYNPAYKYDSVRWAAQRNDQNSMLEKGYDSTWRDSYVLGSQS